MREGQSSEANREEPRPVNRRWMQGRYLIHRTSSNAVEAMATRSHNIVDGLASSERLAVPCERVRSMLEVVPSTSYGVRTATERSRWSMTSWWRCL